MRAAAHRFLQVAVRVALQPLAVAVVPGHSLHEWRRLGRESRRRTWRRGNRSRNRHGRSRHGRHWQRVWRSHRRGNDRFRLTRLVAVEVEWQITIRRWRRSWFWRRWLLRWSDMLARRRRNRYRGQDVQRHRCCWRWYRRRYRCNNACRRFHRDGRRWRCGLGGNSRTSVCRRFSRQRLNRLHRILLRTRWRHCLRHTLGHVRFRLTLIRSTFAIFIIEIKDDAGILLSRLLRHFG